MIKCYNAVSLAGNVRYLDFVLNEFELELWLWVRTDLVPCTTTGTRGTTQRVVQNKKEMWSTSNATHQLSFDKFVQSSTWNMLLDAVSHFFIIPNILIKNNDKRVYKFNFTLWMRTSVTIFIYLVTIVMWYLGSIKGPSQ